MADTPINQTPGPSEDRTDLAQAVRALDRLVNLATLQTDLLRATNYILLQGTGKASPGGGGGGGGGRHSQDLESVFSKYFGKDTSDNVNPAKGLGRYTGKKLGQKWRDSRAKRWGKGGSNIGQGLAKTLHLPNKAVKAAGMAGSVVGKVVGAATSVVEAFIKARNAVDNWTNNAFESAARLAEVSGSMAGVMAQREVDQINRDIKRGEATAGSAQRLQTAESERKDEENILGTKIDNATNNILAVMNNLITPIVKAANGVVGYLEQLPLIGDMLKRLMEGDEIGEGSLLIVADAARKDVADMERRAETLMDIARRAGGAAGGVRPPDGAAPLGRIP